MSFHYHYHYLFIYSLTLDKKQQTLLLNIRHSFCIYPHSSKHYFIIIIHLPIHFNTLQKTTNTTLINTRQKQQIQLLNIRLSCTTPLTSKHYFITIIHFSTLTLYKKQQTLQLLNTHHSCTKPHLLLVPVQRPSLLLFM